MAVHVRQRAKEAPTQDAAELPELLWPGEVPRLTIVRGLAPTRRLEFADALAAGSVGWARAVAAPSAQFETFSSVRGLAGLLLEVAEREALGLVEPERELAQALLRHGAEAVTPVARIAESITFAVTRRISRESHHSALLLDRLARLLLAVVRECPSLRRGVTVVVPDLERWDRPSVRLLYRLVALAEEDDPLTLVALAPYWRKDPADGRVAWARAIFLAHLCALPTVRAVELEEPSPPALAIEQPQLASTGAVLVEIGAALAHQNYERVYLLCGQLGSRAETAAERAEAHRLTAIAHAQLGDYDAALAELAHARRLADDPRLRAHLSYLSGLVSTKRTYDLPRAKRHYARGLRELEGLDTSDSGVRLERAWLLNGQALVATIGAKAAEPAERERLFEAAFGLELEAYELARGIRTPAGSYLRHNLLANITFLLEIARRYEQALEFWSRAFERYLASDSPGFQTMFDYRLGVLLFRLGRNEDALEALARVRSSCRVQHDPFTEEKVCLAEAHLAFTAGALDEALARHGEGAQLAVRLRDRGAYRLHLAGLLWAAARSGDSSRFARVAAAVADDPVGAALLDGARLDGLDPERALEEAGVTQPVPSPKVSPYVPSVDLEGSPDMDLNRYLVSAGGPLIAGRR